MTRPVDLRGRLKTGLAAGVRTVSTTLMKISLPVAPGWRILTFHEVLARGERVDDPYNQVEAGRFERQLRVLGEAGFHPCSVAEAFGDVRPVDDAGNRRIALTFDDGLEEHFSLVLPILESFGYTATFYVISGALEGSVAIGDRALKYMTSGMVRELADRGMEIGSHGRTHSFLTGLGTEGMNDEIAGSANDLHALLGMTPQSFAYPFGERGAFDDRCIRELRMAGYRHAVTTVIGANSREQAPFHLNRIPIYDHDSDELLLAKASGYYDWVGAFQDIWLGVFPPAYR